MKKIFSVLMACFVLYGTSINAQTNDTTSAGQDIKNGVKKAGKAVGKGAKKAGKTVAKGAKKAGKKTAEVASKGLSEVKDKTYKGKQGPDGQTIYIDKYSKYYWVDEKGVKQYVSAAQLKDKMD